MVNHGRLLVIDIMTGARNPTKREVLRVVMMVFDPLGLIAFVVVFAEILLRDIWKSGIGLDEPISNLLLNRWMKWMNILPQLRNIRIPRCYSLHGYQQLKLHTFVDASKKTLLQQPHTSESSPLTALYVD